MSCYKRSLTENEMVTLSNAVDELQVNNGDKILVKTMISASGVKLKVLYFYSHKMICKSNEWNDIFDVLQKMSRI